jgi:hypothetical protein
MTQTLIGIFKSTKSDKWLTALSDFPYIIFEADTEQKAIDLALAAHVVVESALKSGPAYDVTYCRMISIDVAQAEKKQKARDAYMKFSQSGVLVLSGDER